MMDYSWMAAKSEPKPKSRLLAAWTTFLSIALIAVCALILAGCAEVSAIRSGAAEHGADAADQTLESALWVVCNGSSVGAIKRRFQTNEDQAAYNTLCPLGDLP